MLSPAELSAEQIEQLAHRVGKRLLTDDQYLDLLSNALDGKNIQDMLSISDN